MAKFSFMAMIVIVLPLSSITFGCAAPSIRDLETDRVFWEHRFATSGILDKATEVSHLSYVGSCDVAGTNLYVFDLRQTIAGMSAPRGMNYVVVIREDGSLHSKVRYIDQRPLRCSGNQVALFGNLDVLIGEEYRSGDALVLNEKEIVGVASTSPQTAR